MSKFLQSVFSRLAAAVLCVLLCAAANAQCINSGSALAATVTPININCTANDGSLTVNASGGFRDATAPNGTGYSYAITAGPVTRVPQTVNVFSALPAGTYTVTVTACNGTVLTKTNNIVGGTVPAALNYSPTIFKSLCADNNAIKINPTGGRAPYTIAIISTPAGSVPTLSGDTIRGLATGSLNFSITDACGNSISPATTITTNPVMPASSAIYSSFNYFPCAGSYNNPSATTTTVGYLLNLTNNSIAPSFVVDSFKTELYFNNTLMQTIVPSAIGSLTNTVFMNFTGYGFGVYAMRSYYKCSNAASYVKYKTDSVVIGNLPASPAGTSTNLGLGNNSTPYTLRCNDWDWTGFLITNNLWNATIGGGAAIQPLGKVWNVQSAPATAVMIAGPASQVGTTYNIPTGGYVFDHLLYDTTYAIEVTGFCGEKDTLFLRRSAAPFVKTPAAVLPCTSPASGVLGAVSPVFGQGRANFPTVLPMKYTFLSGTPIPWISGASYPITMVDSVGGALVTLIASAPNATYTVAYENGCGQKDTTTYTINCTPAVPGIVTTSVVPHCGNTGDITITNAVTNQKLSVAKLSGPAGNTVPTVVLTTSTASNTFFNQPAGTYTFVGTMSVDNNSAIPFKPSYEFNGHNTIQGATAAQTSTLGGFPLVYEGRSASQFSIQYSGSIDTSKLRIWDTTIVVVVPNTTLTSSIPDNFLCKSGGSGTTILAHAQGVSPFSFSYSTAGSGGPYSTPVSDSLISVAGIPAGTPMWVKTTDPCGNTSIATTTVASLQATTTTACAGGIATVTPNPFSSAFVYELVQVSSGTVTSFNYPTKPTIDLNNPANAGQYVLRYKLVSGSGSRGCVADSSKLLASVPCNLVVPVRLTSFTGVAAGCSVHLAWATSLEQNSSYYEVQQSTDGIHFTKAATVPSQNNPAGASYSYVIGSPAQGIGYYRIRAVDLDGRSTLSPVAAVRSSCRGTISVTPSPASDHITISGLTGSNTIMILDATGRLMTNVTSTGTSQLIRTISFAKGTYVVRVIGDDGITESIKIVKE